MVNIGRGLEEMFGCLFTFAILGVIAVIGLSAYLFFSSTEIESKTVIKPEIVIEVIESIKDGVHTIKQDTTYIYKPNK